MIDASTCRQLAHLCVRATGDVRHCLQVLASKVAALEGRLQGVDNLAGRAAAQDAIAEQLGIPVPALDTQSGPRLSASAVVARFRSAVDEARRRAREGLLARLERESAEMHAENAALRQCAAATSLNPRSACTLNCISLNITSSQCSAPLFVSTLAPYKCIG
jgi:hypothetical protein